MIKDGTLLPSVTKKCGVVIGLNPGDISTEDKLRSRPTWHATKPCKAHPQLLKQLEYLGQRSEFAGVPAVTSIVILNAFSVVNPSPKHAKDTVRDLPIESREKYALKSISILDYLAPKWVWCAWSQELDLRIAGVIGEKLIEYSRRANAPKVFWVKGKKKFPRVCHFKSGLYAKNIPVAERQVGFLPADLAPAN